MLSAYGNTRREVSDYKAQGLALRLLRLKIASPRYITLDFASLLTNKEGMTMENRVALIGIIVENKESVAPLNEILHTYGEYIIGRMGLPYAKRDIAVISVALDAPTDVISSITGKIGMLKGVTAKSLMAKMEE
jgi:putative iron-only hydrogenase system regulator